MGVFATQDHIEEIFTQCSERYEITATFRFELYKYLYESEVRNTCLLYTSDAADE